MTSNISNMVINFDFHVGDIHARISVNAHTNKFYCQMWHLPVQAKCPIGEIVTEKCLITIELNAMQSVFFEFDIRRIV